MNIKWLCDAMQVIMKSCITDSSPCQEFLSEQMFTLQLYLYLTLLLLRDEESDMIEQDTPSC
jgi:hypothetical protein